MGSWVLNSQTGGITYQEQPTPESEVERQQRLSNLRNRLSGNAGHGMMFSATNGGVQRTYDPNYSSTNLMKSQPYTTDTGRSYAATDIEKEYGEQLKGIGATAGGAIRDRLEGISTKVQDINSTLDPYSRKTTSVSNINALLDTTKEKATKESMISSAQKEADTEVSKRLSNLQELINTEAAEGKNLNTLYSGINILPTSTGAQTSKEASSIQNALRKLMSTKIDPSGTSLYTAQNIAGNKLNEYLSGITSADELYKTKEAELLAAKEGWGSKELSALAEEISGYADPLSKLKAAKASDFWYDENVDAPILAQNRADLYRSLGSLYGDDITNMLSSYLKSNPMGEGDFSGEGKLAWDKVIDNLVEKERINDAFWGNPNSYETIGDTIREVTPTSPWIGDKALGRNIDIASALDSFLKQAQQKALQDFYYKYSGTGKGSDYYKYWG